MTVFRKKPEPLNQQRELKPQTKNLETELVKKVCLSLVCGFNTQLSPNQYPLNIVQSREFISNLS